MTGRDVSVLLRVMWTIIIPIFITISFFVMLAQYSTPAYGDGYEYSSGAVGIGIFVGMVPIIAMVVVGIVTVLRQKGSLKKRLRTSLKPSKDWAPNDRGALDEYMLKPYTYPRTWWNTFVLNIRGTKHNSIL